METCFCPHPLLGSIDDASDSSYYPRIPIDSKVVPPPPPFGAHTQKNVLRTACKPHCHPDFSPIGVGWPELLLYPSNSAGKVESCLRIP